MFECKLIWCCSYIIFLSNLEWVRKHDRTTQRWATRFGLCLVFLKWGGGEQMKGERGFVPFLFPHSISYEGEHHQKHKSTKDSQGNLTLYWNIGIKSLCHGIISICEILRWSNLKMVSLSHSKVKLNVLSIQMVRKPFWKIILIKIHQHNGAHQTLPEQAKIL